MVPPSVSAALSKPLVGHLDPTFLALMDDLQAKLRDVFRTRNPLTIAVSGTGSAGMEAALVNLLEPGDDGRLTIHYDRYHDIVAALLEKVFAVQYDGDPEKAEAFIETWTAWDDDVHGRLAEAMKATERYRYAYVTYGALEKNAP